MESYKLIGTDGRSPLVGYDYTPYIPHGSHGSQPGEWLPVVERLAAGVSGYHVAPVRYLALEWAGEPSLRLWRAELGARIPMTWMPSMVAGIQGVSAYMGKPTGYVAETIRLVAEVGDWSEITRTIGARLHEDALRLMEASGVARGDVIETQERLREGALGLATRMILKCVPSHHHRDWWRRLVSECDFLDALPDVR